MSLIAKICLIGDGRVGKTSLSNRYYGRGFNSDYLPTLGSNFLSKVTRIDTETGSTEIRFQIWDLAGQPSYDQIRAIYYKGAVGVLLIFDLTEPDSLEHLEKWAKEYFVNCGLSRGKLVVLGNKVDLKDDRKVFSPTIKQYIKDRIISKFPNIVGEVEYFETSAITGENVNQVFLALGKSVIDILQK